MFGYNKCTRYKMVLYLPTAREGHVFTISGTRLLPDNWSYVLSGVGVEYLWSQVPSGG